MKVASIIMLCIASCIIVLFTACDEEARCDGRGELVVTNKSLRTVQMIIIDGTNYGTIDPDETKTIELPSGKYTLEFDGVSGGGGCSPSQVTIDACGSVGRSCSN
ncbi:MAG: hypothetical protein SFV52_08140 [Saprospiraceae bacterium]|nr:hypothetical protein [Saprospiraceae bacterium]